MSLVDPVGEQIQALEDQQRDALRRKAEAVRRGDDHQAAVWDGVKADSRDAAARLRAEVTANG